MKRLCLEPFEPRRMLTWTFTQEVVDLPLGDGQVMVVADVNQDSRDDLIIGAGDNVHVLIRQDGGGFANSQTTKVGEWVRGFLVADLNGDERLDIAVHTANSVYSLLDMGVVDSEWQGFESQRVISHSGSENIQVGNINDDDFADVIVETRRDIFLLVGNGDGTFRENGSLSLAEFLPDDSPEDPSLPWVPVFSMIDMDVGDLNDDGFDDIIVSAALGFDTLSGVDYGGSVISYVNDSSGGFTRNIVSDQDANASIFLHDVNRDNHLDIMLGGPGGDNIQSTVLAGIGDGSFRVRDGSSAGLRGDFRIESSNGQRAYTIRRQDGGGAYFPGGLFIEDGASLYAIDLLPWRNGIVPHYMDVDSDGVDEVVGLAEGSLVVIQPTAASPIVEPERIQFSSGNGNVHGLSPKFLDDFDNDGYIDQAWAVGQGWERDPDGQVVNKMRISVRWGDPEREIRSRVPTTDVSHYDLRLGAREFSGSFRAQTADVNNDGLMDMQLETSDSGVAITIFGSADRTLGWEYVSGVRFENRPPHLAAQGDIDGDGLVDQISLHDSWLDGLFTVRRGAAGAAPGDGPRESAVEDLEITYQFRKGWDYFDIQDESIRLADMTGDGVLDVIYFDDINPNFYVFPGVSSLLPGDVDKNGEVNLADLEMLIAHVRGQQVDLDNLKLDWTGDQRVNERDVDHLVERVFGTQHGDSNLDGRVDFADFLILSANFEADGSWSDGDFNLDATVNFEDFLLLSANFGFDSSEG